MVWPLRQVGRPLSRRSPVGDVDVGETNDGDAEGNVAFGDPVVDEPPSEGAFARLHAAGLI